MTKLITSEPNIRYFSGFTGSVGILLIHNNSTTLIVDGRYTEQAKLEVKKGVKVLQAPTGMDIWECAIGMLKKNKIKKAGFEDDKLSTSVTDKVKRFVPGLELHSISKEIREQRMIKSRAEIDLISKAALIADLTFDCITHIIKPGMTELEISAHMDYLMKTFKAEWPAFETLVSSGKLSSKPHGKPTEKVVLKGELIVLDFGARYKGYNSDITRMVSLGEPTKKQKDLYQAAFNAQIAAIGRVRSGIKANEVDKAARESLKKAGLEKYFTHGTGHGIGLQVHEGPRVALKSNDVLKEGMVMTIEPGIYIPGFGGFRIEDMVLVKRGGCEVLTKSPKELKVIA